MAGPATASTVWAAHTRDKRQNPPIARGPELLPPGEFVSLRLNSLGYGQLRLVEEALDRVQSGDFGVCLACEQPIPSKRLQALPWARYCVPCQEAIGMTQAEDLQEARPRL